MSSESQSPPKPAVLPTAAPSEEDLAARLLTQLEEKVRRSPLEAVLVAFLIGGLLQVLAVRSLILNLIRLVLWLATPFLFAFAVWRIYQAFESGQNLRQSSFPRHRAPGT
jgi:hypothetical protein